MNNCMIAEAVNQELLGVVDSKDFIETLDCMYDAYVSFVLAEECRTSSASEVYHYRQLRKFLERLSV